MFIDVICTCIYSQHLHTHIYTHKQYAGRHVGVPGTETMTFSGGCLSGVSIISSFGKQGQELMLRAGHGGPQGNNVCKCQGIYKKGKFKVEVNLKGNCKS